MALLSNWYRISHESLVTYYQTTADNLQGDDD